MGWKALEVRDPCTIALRQHTVVSVPSGQMSEHADELPVRRIIAV